jgi:hypothetical protein
MHEMKRISIWFSENDVLPAAMLLREIDKGLAKSRAEIVLVSLLQSLLPTFLSSSATYC